MTEDREAVPPEQIDAVLDFAEIEHGEALEFGDDRKAVTLYHIIGLLEDAKDEKLRSPRERRTNRYNAEYIRQSREAREHGYEEATLMTEIGEDEYSGALTLRECYQECRQEHPDEWKLTCAFAATLGYIGQYVLPTDR